MKFFVYILCGLAVLSGCGVIIQPVPRSSSDAAATLRVVPNAPTGIVATVQNTEASLSWVAPSETGGEPLTDYAIQVAAQGSPWFDIDDGVSTETSAVVTGLTDGTSYAFRVAAVNSVGRGSFSSSSETITIDASAPVVSIASTSSSSTNTDIPITVTFSEPVTGFVVGDISVTNGTAGSFLGSESSYSFIVTPNAEGAVSISVASGKVQDAAGNQNTASNTLLFTYDTTAPSFPSVSINNGASYTTTTLVDLTLSATGSPIEMYVTNTAGCGSGGNWESYSSTKTAWVLSQTNTTATVYAKFKDAAGNVTACASDTIIHDNMAPTGPTISINSDAVMTNSTNVTLALSASGATQMYVTNTSGCASSGTLEPYSTSKAWTLNSGDGTRIVYVKYLDDAGNASSCVSDSITLLPAPPPDPISLSATVDHSTQITLNWTSGGGTTDKFQVAYQIGSTAPVDCESGTIVSYSTIGTSTNNSITVSPATDYAFRVCARDTYGQFSNGVTTTTTTGWTNEAYLKAPNNSANDWFGFSSSLSGDTLVVGAPTEDNGVTTITNGTHTAADGFTSLDSGAAYVFKRTGATWTNEAYLKAPNNSELDYFGWSTSMSGDTIVVGAYYEDNGATTITNGTHTADDINLMADSGAAYVFKRAGNAWANEAYLKAPNAHSTDYFGYSTSVSGDTIVVGAYYEDNSATTITNGTHTAADLGNYAESGAAYVFKRTGSTWTNEAYLKSPNNSAGDRFGSPVRISGDTVVVGAYAEDNSITTITNGTYSSADIGTSANSGAVYVFKRTGSTWANEAYLKAPNNSSSDFFGWAVSISADTLVVGAYNEDNSATTITNGTHIAADVGTSSNSGAVYVFKRTGSNWANEAYLKAPNNSVDDSFGWPLSISGDTIVVSALYEDNSAATITNGTYSAADVGTSGNSGAVYVFKRTGTTWANEAYLKAPNNSAGDQFGRSVSISGDTIAVGAFQEDNSATTISNGTYSDADIGTSINSGAVYVFRRAETLTSPTVSSVTPTSNLVAGDSVIIYGSGFRKDATVSVGGVACSSKTVQGPKEIICVLPSAPASGALDIVVTNPDNSTDTLSGALSYDTTPPGSPSISIDSGAVAASSTSVTLTLSATGATQMYVTETSGCSSGGTLEPYSTSKAWTLPSGDGTRTVYVKYFDAAGNASSCVSDSITLLPAPPPEPSNFSATVDHSTQITLSWTSGAGTTDKFQVAYQTGSAAPTDCSSGTVVSYSTIGSSTSTAITVAAVTDYAFRVCARDTYGQFSSGVTATATTGWYQEAYLKAPNAGSSDWFGNSAAVSGDTVVVGAYYEDSNQTTISNGTLASSNNSAIDSGAAYVFKRTGSTWALEAYLKAPNAESNDYFGASSAISGDTIVVGAFGEDSNQTTITNGATASSNNSVSSSGAAYVFKRVGSTWAQEAYLKVPNAESDDLFGYSSAISGDTIVVGAYLEASSQTTITNGTTASSDNSAISSGAAYIFKRTGTTWAQESYLKAPNAKISDWFGYSSAISGDTIVVGAYGEDSNQTTITNGTTASSDYSESSSGAAYVFKRTGTTWAQEAYLKVPNAESGDYFGISAAVSGDTIVVGAYGEDSNQTTITNGTTASSDNSATDSGAAYIFKRTGSIWSPQAYLKAPNAESGDYFGYSSRISGDTIVVGASGEDSNQTTITNGATASINNSAGNSGAAYIFKRTGSIWSLEAYLKSPNAESADLFGISAAVSGDTVVVGARLEDSNQTTITNGATASSDNSASSSGAVYVFRRAETLSSPTVSSVTPASNLAVGDSVVIFGSGFRKDAIVTVGGTACSSKTVQGPNEIICVLPTMPVSGALDVTVTNPDNSTHTLSGALSYDVTAPGVTLASSSSSSTNTTIPVTVTFSESVTGFVVGDISVTNGTAGSFSGSGSSYSFTVTPTSEGSVSISVAASKAQDSAGNANTASNTLNFTYDITAAEVTLTSSSSTPTNAAIPIDVIFSEPVTGFTVGDLTITNGTPGVLSGSGSSYSFTVTPTSEGSVTISVANSVAQDSAGNNNYDSNLVSFSYDTTAPSSPSVSINSGATYTTTTLVDLTLSATGSPSEMYVTNTAGCSSGGSWETYSTSKLAWTLGQTNTTATVYAKFKDVAGNETSCVSDAIIHDFIPPENPSISINSDATTTSSTSVNLTLSATGATQMYVTNTAGCASGGTLESYSTSKAWTLSSGDGTRTVYVKYLDDAGNASSCVSDSITLLPAPPPDPSSFTAAVDHSTQITLNWTSGAGTTDKFQVAYQTGSTAPADCETGTVVSFSTIGSSTSVAVTVSAVTDYAFIVCSRDIYGQLSNGITTTATTGWYQEAYIKAPNGDIGDGFGYSTSISGDTIIVGAPNESSNQTTITNDANASSDNGASVSGAAYVFKRTGSTWVQEAYLKAPNANTSDQFGSQVFVSGHTIVVGAPYEQSNQTTITNGTFGSNDNTSEGSGAAYVFKRTGSTWVQEAYLKAPNTDAWDTFGYTVSVSGDTVVVGAPYEASNQSTITNGSTASSNNSRGASGAVYVFKRTGSTWAQEAYLKAPNVHSLYQFGWSVSASGDTVVVGSPYEGSNQTTITNGSTASTNTSGSVSGAAYVFKRTGSTWVQEAYLKAPNADAWDNFGNSVSISGDTIVVGASNEGSNQTTLTNGTTGSSDNSFEGSSAGAAYVFKRTGSTWAQEAYLKPPNLEAYDVFGNSTSISGNTILVTAFGESAIQTTITNGTTASSNNSSLGAGAAYVFKRTGSSWAHEAYLKASNGDDADNLGYSASISGDTIVVGSLGEDSNQTTITNGTTASADNSATDSGAVYVFRRAATTGLTPAITSVSPSSFSVAGGGVVSIFGSGFQSGATVTVGGTTCTNPIWQGYNEILCTLPAGTSGAATVTVTNPGGANGSSSSAFSYVMPPDPTGLTATVDHSTQITLNWTSGGGSTSSFQIAYQSGSTAPADCASGTVVSYSTIGSSTSAAITVSAVTDYAFRLCARDTSGGFSSGTTTMATTGWYQEAYMKAPNVGASDLFGYSTAVSGDTIVVGALGEASNQTTITNGTNASADNSAYASGAAYVFTRTGSGWAQEAYLKSSNSEASDDFGERVSISGDTIVVGASGESSNQTTITNGTTASADNSKSGSGAAYVFKRTGSSWAQEAYLKAPNADAADRFGHFTSISGDAIVVGAFGEDSNQTTITNGSTGSTDNSNSGSGAAYVFRRTANTWMQEAYLKPPSTIGINAESHTGNYFGWSLYISGDTIVVGADWEASNQTTITNGTTASADLSKDGSGAAYVFKRTGSTWSQEAYLKAPNADVDDNFGFSTSISGDTIVVGAYKEASNQTTITNGTTASANNGAGVSGAAYVFKRTGSTWAQEAYLKAANNDSYDWFGTSAAISGETIVVGANRESSNQTTITNGTTASGDNSKSTSGAAYVFKRAGSSWTQEAYLKAPNLDSNDQFGYSTAISGDTIVLGATREDSNQTTITNGTTASSDNSASNSGAVYVFRRAETLATPVVSSVTPNTGVLSGDTVVIFGSGFRKDATVTVGGTACTTKTVQGPNEIICTLPSSSAGVQAIQVTNPGGSTSNTDITVTY